MPTTTGFTPGSEYLYGDVSLPYLKTGDNTYQSPRVDSVTHTLQTIDYAHHEIHAGSHFFAYHTAASKNDGETINLYIKTPNTTTWGHMLMKWSSGGAAYAFIQEAPTVTANTGTNAKVIINNNRNSANASVMLDNATTPAAGKFGVDVTITSPGTIVWQDYSGAAKSSGGEGGREEELILKQNTAYVFIVESDAAGIALNMQLEWYEHVSKSA